MGVEAILERRRMERRAHLARARGFVSALKADLGLRAAVVFGSVARGDFNLWSDVDVLVVAEGFREGPLRRAEDMGPRPSRVRPVAWTPEEWRSERSRGNPIVREALETGVWLVGSPESI